MIRWFGSYRELEDDLALYRNLLALMPYCVRVRTVVIPRAPEPTSVVYYRPSRRLGGKHLGWN